jgi:hypothetical protein
MINIQVNMFNKRQTDFDLYASNVFTFRANNRLST